MNQVSEAQLRLLQMFRLQAGEQFVGKEFDLVDHESKKYARLAKIEIPLMLSDSELLTMGRLGYLVIKSGPPPTIVFTAKSLSVLSSKKSQSPSLGVEQLIIRQVYAWLSISLLAALFALVLLGLVVQRILDGSITDVVATSVLTAISGFLSTVFFKNYHKANEDLKSLHENPPSAGEESKVDSTQSDPLG
jgi:hypothetical protein